MYQELVQLTTQLFGVVPARFQYQDDEEDMITVTNDLELSEAVSVSVKSKSILRVFVIGMQSIIFTKAKQKYITLHYLLPSDQFTPPITFSHTLMQRPRDLPPATIRQKRRLRRKRKPSPPLMISCVTCPKCSTLLSSSLS